MSCDLALAVGQAVKRKVQKFIPLSNNAHIIAKSQGEREWF
jgi:hypothetical protein